MKTLTPRKVSTRESCKGTTRVLRRRQRRRKRQIDRQRESNSDQDDFTSKTRTLYSLFLSLEKAAYRFLRVLFHLFRVQYEDILRGEGLVEAREEDVIHRPSNSVSQHQRGRTSKWFQSLSLFFSRMENETKHHHCQRQRCMNLVLFCFLSKAQRDKGGKKNSKKKKNEPLRPSLHVGLLDTSIILRIRLCLTIA